MSTRIMDTLRWILLLVGVVIIAVVYFSGRRQRRDVVNEIASADPVMPLGRVEPRVESKLRNPEVKDVDQELSQLSNLIAENRRPAVVREPAAVSETPPPSTSHTTSAARTAPATASTTVNAATKSKVARPAPPVEDKIIVIYVMAPPGGRFAGPDVLRAAEGAGLSYGNMAIFHRLANPENPDSDAIFSLANSVEPGTFDIDRLDDFSTPGLTLFMQLPGPMNGITALDSMVAAARHIAMELKGELRDQSRSVLSKQTVEHLHTEIMEYQRRQRLVHATP